MRIMNIRWKRWLLLFTALVMMVTLVAGCAEEEKPTIKFGDSQFRSLWINNAIAKFIIEEGYGYPAETIEMTTPIAQVSLQEGDIHVWMELWQQNLLEWYNEQIDLGNIENGGMIYEAGPQFWCIPDWIHEEYNINTVEDMKEHWELFKGVEDPSKGEFINCMSGWQCAKINEVKFEAYGLDEYYNIITPGTSGAEDAAIIGPMKKHEPVFAYYWAPTALMGMFDFYILEEPEYDSDVWDKVLAAKDDESLRPVDEACAYESLPVDKGFHKSLKEIAPDVHTMLKKMVVGLDPLNRTCAWCVENEIQDYEPAAVWYLREYDSRWETWVTTDAYNKIKTALDAYGSIP